MPVCDLRIVKIRKMGIIVNAAVQVSDHFVQILEPYELPNGLSLDTSYNSGQNSG